jgi:hypothetical protein
MADYYYTDAARQPAGPLPLEQLQAMYNNGELAPGALVAEVGADHWEPADDVFGRPAAAAGPRTAPPVVPGPIVGPTDAIEPLAAWSFGLGIASWACIGILPAIPGVITGHMALNRMKRDGNANGAAKVLAIIGLVASYLNLAIIPFFLLIGLGFGLLGAFTP